MLEIQRRRTTPFLALLALPATAMGFALSVQISALSWILSTRYGLHIDEIGLVWAAGPLAGIAGQLLVGVFSDGVWLWGGRRRPFIIIGGLLSAAMLLALPRIGLLSHALGFETVLGVAITVALALDLSINISFNPTRSIITDVTDDGPMRTRGYALMQTVSGSFGVLAYGVGALFGNDALIATGAVLVLVFSLVPALLIEEPRSLDAAHGAPAARPTPPSVTHLATTLLPLWAVIGYDIVAMGLHVVGYKPPGLWLEGACLVLTALLYLQTLRARDRGPEFVREDLVEFRKVLAAHALSWLGMQTMFVYMLAFVQQRFPTLDANAGGHVLSTSFLILSAVGALSPSLVLEPLCRRFGQILVHAAALGLMAAGFLAIDVSGAGVGAIYGLMVVLGIGWGAIVSLPFAIMSERVDESRIGLYMGVFNLSVVLPQLVASLGIGTLVAQSHDKGVVFLVAAVSMGLSAFLWLSVRRHPTAA
jgi:MFS family permease